MFYSLLSKFQVRHEGFSFYCFRKSDEGGDTDLIEDFCLPNGEHYIIVMVTVHACNMKH